MTIKITADSTCDLGKEQAARFGVAIMPLTVVLGDEVFHDGVDITPQDIFDYVSKTGILPKTGAPSIDDYVEFFKEQLKTADAVIHINISRLASSSHDNAAVAAKKFKGKVFAVDSMALSTGQGLLCVKACDLAAEDRKPAEIVRILEELRHRINTSFVPDRLDYLHKGGRCSLAAMLGAKVLKLHPMIDMKDGRLYAKKKYMGGLERCLTNYLKDLKESYPAYDRARCFITHSNCERETVEKVRAQVESMFDFDEIIETVAGCVVTGHCGKNTLGVLFIYD